MSIINFNKNKIELTLTSPLSKIRICDKNGNHCKKPSSEGINSDKNFIEWMITNGELKKIIKEKLKKTELKSLIEKIQNISLSLKATKYLTRSVRRKFIGRKMGGFSIYESNELFYSFEKNISKNLLAKITFKIGDYTLAPHMFILINFRNKKLSLINKSGKIKKNNILGSGAKAIWSISKKEVKDIVCVLACSSENHKLDIISFLEDLSN